LTLRKDSGLGAACDDAEVTGDISVPIQGR
jgi:hypothetical protein